jgi:hypothetical protein
VSGTPPLSQAELARVAAALMRGENRPVSIEEVERAVEWAEGVRVGAALLELVLAGQVELVWDEAKFEFAFRRSGQDAP